ncbi:MAG: hypothetical protein AAF533_25235 [Acidobacteriota bacterium]
MDWLWPLYSEYVRRNEGEDTTDDRLQAAFLKTLGGSFATLYVMEPIGTTIRFKGLGRWALPSVPELLTDPNAFIAATWGGGKFKINFHHGLSFVGTHNFRTHGEELWREMEEIDVEPD